MNAAEMQTESCMEKGWWWRTREKKEWKCVISVINCERVGLSQGRGSDDENLLIFHFSFFIVCAPILLAYVERASEREWEDCKNWNFFTHSSIMPHLLCLSLDRMENYEIISINYFFCCSLLCTTWNSRETTNEALGASAGCQRARDGGEMKKNGRRERAREKKRKIKYLCVIWLIQIWNFVHLFMRVSARRTERKEK